MTLVAFTGKQNFFHNINVHVRVYTILTIIRVCLATLAFHNCLLYCTTHAPFRGIPFCCSNDDPPIASRHVQVNVELFNDQSGFILEDCQNVTCNPPYTNRHCSLMG